MRTIPAKTAAAVLVGAALVAAGPASASMARTARKAISVPCSAAALAAAITGASNGGILSLKGSCTYRLAAPLPAISANLTIRGDGATLERSSAPGTPDFTMLEVAGHVDLAISKLTFTGDTTATYGGAIANSGTLTVTGATFSNNVAEDGGALENYGVAAIAKSKFVNNHAGFNGGAVHNEGSVTVTDSRFSGNSAGNFGAGIFDGVEGNAAAITGSAFRQNKAEAGGAIYNEDVVRLTRTVISGGSASGQGGGIYNDWGLTVTSSKVLRNTAAAGGGIYDGDLFGPPGTVVLKGSTVTGNKPDNCEPVNSIASCRDPAVRRAASAGSAGRGRSQPIDRARALARDFSPRAGG